jgi:hypothetical protein
MLELITDLPSTVVGVRASGTVSKEDFDKVLVPALSDLAQRTGKINYLLVLETDISNFTLGAWIDDLKLGVKHFMKWNRIAIVSNQRGVTRFSDMFGLVMPGDARGFPPEELEQAKTWVAGS